MAGGSTGYFTSMLEYYDNYANEVLKRWNYAMYEIKGGEYAPTQLLSDVFYVWGYGLLGLMPLGPSLVASNLFAKPVLLVELHVGDDTATGYAVVNVPGNSAPKMATLTEKAGNTTIPDANVQLNPIQNRTQLEVKLVNLKALPTQPKVGQIYRAEVTLDGKTLAFVHVPILPAP